MTDKRKLETWRVHHFVDGENSPETNGGILEIEQMNLEVNSEWEDLKSVGDADPVAVAESYRKRVENVPKMEREIAALKEENERLKVVQKWLHDCKEMAMKSGREACEQFAEEIAALRAQAAKAKEWQELAAKLCSNLRAQAASEALFRWAVRARAELEESDG